MDAFRKIAEERIRRAIEEGEFDNLANAGKPLSLEDDTWIPEDLRLAYHVLKNADCLPPELELKKEILNLKTLINTIDDDKERLKKIRELNFKLLKLSTTLKRPVILEEYEERLIEKLIG
jgi:hypothetical protein